VINLARQVKCPRCQGTLSKEDALEHKKKYYHQECFETWRREGQDYEDLKSYICQLYRLDAPTGLMLKQIKEYKEELKYKYKGMELALRYFHETLGNRVQENSGVGIIPFVYEDAKSNYIKQQRIIESMKNLEENEEVTIYINTDKTKRKSKMIDISAI